MGNKIFHELFKQQVEYFRNSFSNTSQNLFYDEEKEKLIHPGEFGIYRENICKSFLKFIIPAKLDIDDGFIINSFEGISTQCDIVIYDKGNTPLIRSMEFQKFFPVETVIGVGEVKSDLSRSDLKAALLKLSEIKKLRDWIVNDGIISLSGQPTIKFDPVNNLGDQIFTFLLCKKLDFNHDNLVDELKEIYGPIDQRYWHNIILSLDDGLILYSDFSEEDDGVPCQYPVFRKQKLNSLMILGNQPGNIDHFIVFAQHVTSLCQNTNPQILNIFKYLIQKDQQMQVIREDRIADTSSKSHP